ncbi:MAG: AAA family ATPase [Comamonadaceae bacterium]|nr:AAA family ATPase [Comamonadaceae bacterium]
MRSSSSFRAGFGALTGETGAGKSILVDALALALGDRADAAVVRSGCARAEIAAEFDDRPACRRSRLAGRATTSRPTTARCLLRRVVDAGGRSRGYINGIARHRRAAAGSGELLVDIHGQHAHHALLRADDPARAARRPRRR